MATKVRSKGKKDKRLRININGEESDENLSSNEIEVMDIDDESDSSSYLDELETQDDKEESETVSWGKKKQDFYEGGSSNSESDEEDWSEVEMQDEEARNIQEKRIMRLEREDFAIDDIIKQGEAVKDPKSNDLDKFNLSLDDADQLLESLNNLSKNGVSNEQIDVDSISLTEEAIDEVKNLRSELSPILSSIKEKLIEVKERVRVLLDLTKSGDSGVLVTEKGMDYLDSKNGLLLMYISYLYYYMMLKMSPNVNIKDHPVLLRLVTLRTMMEKLKPIDVKLQPYIDRILQMAEKSSQVDNFLTSVPRPDRFVIDEEAEKDLDFVSGDLEGSTNYSSNDDLSQVSEEFNENSNKDEYKIPKNIPVEFSDKKLTKTEKMMKQLERERQRLLRTDIIRQMRSSIQETPEVVGRENIEQLPQLEKLQRQIQERIEFEEGNMIRLPKTKKDKKEERLYKKLLNQVESGVNTLDDLAQFAEKATDMATDSKKNSLSRYLSNASKLNKEVMRSKIEQQNSDKSITEKLIKRKNLQSEMRLKNKYIPEEDSNYEDINENSIYEDDEIMNNEYLQDVLKINQEKKQQKLKRKQEIDSANMPNIDDLVDSGSRRASTKEMIKNKGLTRKRKKIEGNARVHNRLKYKKALKRLKGTQRSMREYENNYSGESTGVKDNIKRSVTLS